jgi:membrane peptidoglycan carboxypeptidase
MRQMMRRVVTMGTAKRLHLVGYTLAGKTGTAQIFDFAHHVYTHKYNASFLGFAPMNNPKILVVATVSGTTGEAGFGSSAAGPAVQSVTEAALRLREVPRDIPEEVDELEQKEIAQKAKLKHSEKPVEEVDTVADLSTPLTEEEMAEAAGTLDAPKTPDFTGKTVKGVMEEAAEQGLDVEMLGDGLARAQFPPAGAPLLPGTQIRVRFTR